MPSAAAADHYQRASSSVVSMAFRGRSVLSLRRNQIVSMDQPHDDHLHGLDLFQSHVADGLNSLIPPPSSPDMQLPSLPFLQKLLDTFLSCEAEFNNLLEQNLVLVSRSPADRLLSDLLDRAVKSLDACNEITQSLQSILHWNRHADIASSALPASGVVLGDGQLNRARRALAKLLASAEPSSQHGAVCATRRTERAWSFLSRNGCSAKEESLSRSFLPGKQLQAMAANLVPPKGCEAGGLALAVYTMSSVLVFVVWALVASFSGVIPALTPLGPPKQLAWAPALIGLQERIGEELRRRARKGGVLAELVNVERCGRELMEAVAASEAGVNRIEVAGRAGELGEASGRLEKGLGPFERQLREMFHRIVRSREEVMRFLEQSSRSSPPFVVM